MLGRSSTKAVQSRHVVLCSAIFLLLSLVHPPVLVGQSFALVTPLGPPSGDILAKDGNILDDRWFSIRYAMDASSLTLTIEHLNDTTGDWDIPASQRGVHSGFDRAVIIIDRNANGKLDTADLLYDADRLGGRANLHSYYCPPSIWSQEQYLPTEAAASVSLMGTDALSTEHVVFEVRVPMKELKRGSHVLRMVLIVRNGAGQTEIPYRSMNMRSIRSAVVLDLSDTPGWTTSSVGRRTESKPGLPPAERKLLSVLDLRTDVISKTDADLIVSRLVDSLRRSNQYRILEKGERDTILAEQEYSLGPTVDETRQVEIGRMLSADRILTGSLARVGSTFVLALKILDVATAETVSTSYRQYVSIDQLLNDPDLTLELLR